jgi:hypothetical protein
MFRLLLLALGACILLASVPADRYFQAPAATWVPAAVATQPVDPALQQTFSWPESASVPSTPGFMPTWATLDIPRAVVEMRGRLNMKKEKRKRNKMNAYRFKKPETRWRGNNQRAGSDSSGAKADADAKVLAEFFTETEAETARLAEAAR